MEKPLREAFVQPAPGAYGTSCSRFRQCPALV